MFDFWCIKKNRLHRQRNKKKVLEIKENNMKRMRDNDTQENTIEIKKNVDEKK